ncbi:hypothetical protein A5630_05740 [Mycolicibacterium mucogenicum]|uniref:Uncharacterized protein n=1 Tax=Mycolicibacterium mucogenicum TaxID=56689 RepID=A0A1A3GNK4_MYCMU|nr:hypothetical protein [Mycolicibacterium mucogenicum]OBJ36976.1 hypothetical protein A5630_05740 [Mycolicibacterium mucogenicum]
MVVLPTALIIVAVQCAPGADYRPNSRVDGMRFRWSTEPGIDLSGGEVVPLRAFLESHDLSLFAQTEAAAYRGFGRAVPANTGSALSATGSRHPYMHYVAMSPFPRTMGTEYLHVLRMARTAGLFDAVVCGDLRRVFQYVDDGWGDPHYRPLGTMGGLLALYQDAPGMPIRLTESVMRVLIIGTSEPGLPPQQGTADYPRGDPFGNWTVDGFSVYSGASPEVVPWSSAPTDLDSCNRVLEPVPRTKDADTKPIFAIEPSFPGWPE